MSGGQQASYGSRQLRLFRRARRDGASIEDAAEAAGISIGEARLHAKRDDENPPPEEAFQLIEHNPKETEMEAVDPSTGEIVDTSMRAADGGYVPGACNTLGEFIASLEDGQFDADVQAQLKELAAAMNDQTRTYGGSKGKLTITIDFKQEAQIVYMKAAYKVAMPEEPRAKSVFWTTEDNRFTRSQPNQHHLFGVRDAAGRSSGFRDA